MATAGNSAAQGTPETGVLLVNLGTPDSPTPEAVRRYLAEFLWDPRVVDVSRPLWWLILHGIILRTRPARSAALYQKIWTSQGSPLLLTSARLRQDLEAELERRAGHPVPVGLGMRYGNPPLAEALRRMGVRGCRKVVVLPLFPQYSIATTLSVRDALDAASRLPGMPEAELVPDYHDHPAYIAALAASVREAWEAGGRPDRLLMSFHGTPVRYRDVKGDPYHAQCTVTARLLAEALELPPDAWTMTFQSRFGREEWLTPYTDETLIAVGRQGLKRVDVLCPGFPADCLETLEEIAMGCARTFREAGGGEMRYIPALNDRPDHVAALAERLAEYLA